MRLFIILSAVFLCAGCAVLFAPQELSDNYAVEDGVMSDAPEAVDGDLDTISNSTRIIISLPEKKSIRKIIIYNTNISNFILYEYLGFEGQWKIIKNFKGNTSPKIVVNTQVTTDKIRLFVTDTSGTRFVEPGGLRDVDGRVNIFSTGVDARPEIQEIELYGLIDKEEKAEPKAPLF